MLKRTIAVCALLCWSSGTLAQHDTGMPKKVDAGMKKVQDAMPSGDAKAAGPSEEDMKAWMEAGTPGAHHEWMAKLAGNWNCDSKMYDCPMEMSESKGTMEVKMVFGGRYQHTFYKGEMMGQAFEGSGIAGYDNTTKKFTSVWTDSMSTAVMVSHGEFNKDTQELTMLGEFADPTTKKMIKSREVSKFIDDNHYSMTFFHTKDGKESKAMELNFTRAGTAPTATAAPAASKPADQGMMDKAKEEAMKKAKEAAEKAKQKLPGQH